LTDIPAEIPASAIEAQPVVPSPIPPMEPEVETVARIESSDELPTGPHGVLQEPITLVATCWPLASFDTGLPGVDTIRASGTGVPTEQLPAIRELATLAGVSLKEI
jgi:hypothetical protein